jgi:hypothetical protein
MDGMEDTAEVAGMTGEEDMTVVVMMEVVDMMEVAGTTGTRGSTTNS